jgi:hypothetical protein
LPDNPHRAKLPQNFWIRFPAGTMLTDHAATLTQEPLIRPGTPDPYQTPKAQP